MWKWWRCLRRQEQGGPSSSGSRPDKADTEDYPAEWPDERWEELLEQWAGGISRYGLELPVLLLGEAHKPVSFVLGQGLYFLQPFLGAADHFVPALGGPGVPALAALLSERRRLEQLLVKLERRARR